MKAMVHLSLIGVLLAFCLAVQAAEVISPGSVLSERPSARHPDLPEFLPEESDSGSIKPPVSEGEQPSGAPGGPSFELRKVAFDGNTVFSDQELATIAKDFVGKKVTLIMLEELRYRLTRHYVDQGYINSGVILKPDQIVTDGIVIYQVLEGQLDEVLVNGTKRLRPAYVRNRIWPDPESPFNIKSLQERFQLLLQDPLIKQLNGELLPGTKPGSANLNLQVTRSRPYELSLGIDNHSPPGTGAERVYAAGVLRNLSGFGDEMDFSGGVSDGADEVFAGYSIPVSANDSRIFLRFDHSDNSVVEEPLNDLDIESETWGMELGLLYPVFRSLGRTVTLGAALAKRENQTFLLGEPFPFSAGADDNGESRVTVLRLSQELVDRNTQQAFALRSTFSFGLDAFDATVHGGNRPDGQYFAWLGQARYARRFGEAGSQLLLRADVQLANDHLLDLERFAVGGANTVRGYRENELVRDNGFAISAEWRYPLWRGEKKDSAENLLQIAMFMDFGSAWNKGESMGRDRLHSVGLGFLWTFFRRIDAELYFAHDLEKPESKEHHDLQDDGIHFRLIFSL